MNLDAEAERCAGRARDAGRREDFAGFYAKHQGLLHGPWCHLRGRNVELDTEGFHADCYACPCYETCSGP